MPMATDLSDATWSFDDLVLSGRLQKDSADILRSISEAADSTSTKVYLVGGMVREIVSKRDQVTSLPDVTMIGEVVDFADALLTNISGSVLVSTSQLHTAKVRIGDLAVDIASARTDIYDPPGFLPQITLVDDIELDLARRDFSLNAMAMPLQLDGLGPLIDLFNGMSDTENGILRVIRRDSFHEDPLRMMRGIRLAARYGYRFERTSEALIAEGLDDLRRMTKRSPQRVFNEFRLWFAEHEDLDTLLDLANQHGILEALGINASFPPGIFKRICRNESDLSRFAVFAYLLDEDSASSLAWRLLMPSDWSETAKDAAIARAVAERCCHNQITDIELYRSLIDLQENVVGAAMFVETDGLVAYRFRDFQTRLRHITSGLNGEDLINLGMEEGPMIGELLAELLALRIEGVISTVSEERQHVLNHLNDG